MGEFEPGWSVEKIKLIGADAVKLLAPFEPGEPISAEHNFAFIEQVYNECKKNDILFLLEPIAFPYNGEKKTDKAYLDRKAEHGHRDGPLHQPVLRRVQGRVPRHARPRDRRPAPRQPPRPERGERAPLGPAVGRASTTPTT